MFARHNGEVTKPLQELPKTSPADLLSKFRSAFPQVDADVNPMEMAGCKEKINVFMNFLR